MQQLSKQPAFELGQIVATPGALAALRKSGQQPGDLPDNTVTDGEVVALDESGRPDFNLLQHYREGPS